MNYFFYFIILFLCFFNFTCSNFEYTCFNSIKEGNYFNYKSIYQIKMGMNKEKILYILGNPILKNPFNENIWYYIFYKDQESLLKKLILIFNEKNILIVVN